MRTTENLLMTDLRHYMASRCIRDLSKIVENKVLNRFRCGHFLIRCLHYSGRELEANLALLAIFTVHLANYLIYGKFIIVFILFYLVIRRYLKLTSYKKMGDNYQLYKTKSSTHLRNNN